GVWVQGHIPERDLARVRLGQKARVTLAADPRIVAEGVVRRNARIFDAEDRTLSIWVELSSPSPRPLPVGMLARLALVVAQPSPPVAVARTAGLREGSRSYCFVQRADGTFERRTVEAGRADDRHVEILRGLDEGEKVATQGVAAIQMAYDTLQ